MNSQPGMGHSVRNLLLELKRGSGGDATAADSKNYVLPAYNDVLVQTCVDEMNGHIKSMNDQANAAADQNERDGIATNKPPMHVRPSLSLHQDVQEESPQQASVPSAEHCVNTYPAAQTQRYPAASLGSSRQAPPGHIDDGSSSASQKSS